MSNLLNLIKKDIQKRTEIQRPYGNEISMLLLEMQDYAELNNTKNVIRVRDYGTANKYSVPSSMWDLLYKSALIDGVAHDEIHYPEKFD